MSSQRDFVTADMRGLKARLEACAATERISVSAVVRRAVERELGEPAAEVTSTERAVELELRKISLRLTASEIDRLDAAARRERLSRSATIGRLLDGAALPRVDEPSGRDMLAALTACNAEMATLGRGIHRLATLLVRAEVEAARTYRRMLDSLDRDVRTYLHLAATGLASLRPAPRSIGPRPKTSRDTP